MNSKHIDACEGNLVEFRKIDLKQKQMLILAEDDFGILREIQKKEYEIRNIEY